MKAIESKWECPSCGNIIGVKDILTSVSGGFKFSGPKRCGCGRKAKFTLQTFRDMDAIIVDPKNLDEVSDFIMKKNAEKSIAEVEEISEDESEAEEELEESETKAEA